MQAHIFCTTFSKMEPTRLQARAYIDKETKGTATLNRLGMTSSIPTTFN